MMQNDQNNFTEALFYDFMSTFSKISTEDTPQTQLMVSMNFISLCTCG